MDRKVILKGIDLIKGATLKKDYNSSIIYDAMPWQMVELKEKTEEWKKWCADYFEWIGLGEVQAKQQRIYKNRMMASGIVDMKDYLTGNEDYTYLNSMLAEESPLAKFYPIIPPFINVLQGEFIKKDLRVFISCVDRQTEDSKLKMKMDMVNEILIEDALKKKQRALAELGIFQVSEEELAQMDPSQQQQATQMNDQFMQEMDTTRKLAEAQRKYKKYRDVMEEFGQLVYNKDRARFNMDELTLEAFVESICNEEVLWHIDMLDDDYRIELIDNAMSFSHQSVNVKYYSSGDYCGWFEPVTVGDIINKDGTRLKEEDFKRLQESVRDLTDHNWGGVGLIPDQFRNYQGAYYDASKKYPNSRTELNKYQYLQNKAIEEIITNTSLTSDQLARSYEKKNNLAFPKLFRRMRLYYRSQRKIGWLTVKDKSGIITFQDWVDENYVVTDDPIYDNSLTKEKSSETLVYGEHIDWSWTNEWRHSIKISANLDHPYWRDRITSFEPIYLDGDPIRYNFTGKSDSPFEVHPPFEGIQWKMKGIRPISFVEQLAPIQIAANIAFNRIPDIMFDDVGLALAINENTAPNNLPGIESGGDPLELAMENLRVNKVLPFKVDRTILKEQGNSAPIIPTVLNLSRIDEGIKYLSLTLQLKEYAGDIVGISRQRVAQAKASETATQTQAGIDYSETQTEVLFTRFLGQLMPRVYQKMIEAAVYYATISGKARAFYQTSEEGNAFLEIENLEGTMRKYSIECKSNAREKELAAKLENLFLNNNTTDLHGYDLALSITESSPANIMENLRQDKIRVEQRREEEYQQQLQAQKQAEQAAMELQRQKHADEMELQNARNESLERQNLIRALGGLQSDNNKDGQLDAYQNLQLQINQMQNNFKNSLDRNNLSFKEKQHADKMDMDNRKLAATQAIEQKKLAVAIANQNKNDDKKLNRQIAKKQGVS